MRNFFSTLTIGALLLGSFLFVENTFADSCIHDDALAKFDSFCHFDGQVITNLPTGNFSAYRMNSDVEKYGQLETKTIRIEQDAKRAVQFQFDFDTGDPDLSAVIIDRDDANFQTLVHGLTTHSGVGSTFTMYIKKDPTHNTLRVCSGKSTPGCTINDNWSFESDNLGHITSNGGFDISGIVVMVVGNEWVVSGISGTSAQGEVSDPQYNHENLSFELTSTEEVPAGASIRFDVPTDFIMDDIENLLALSDIVFLTNNGNDILSEVASASLHSNVVSITLSDTATPIAAGSIVEIAFSNQVIDQNPSLPGQYGVSWVVQDANENFIEQGIFYLDIGEVDVNIAVEEALIMSLESVAVEFMVDPSINNGIQQDKKTTLSISTNSKKYSLLAQLENSQGNNNGIHYFDGTQHHYIENGWDANHGLNNDGRNVFGFNTTGPGEATANFSNIPTIILAEQEGRNSDIVHEIFYDLNVDYLTPTGVYQGIITYTAIPTF